MSAHQGALDLRIGEWVEVRPLDEILATLDSRGLLDNLPFMPEMVAYSGRRFRVRKRADKTCDRVNRTGLRRMRDTVHLGDLRCDGAAHDGCRAACLLYFKEAWLKRVDGALPGPTAPSMLHVVPEMLLRATRAEGSPRSGDDARYVCQATEAFKATEAFRKGDVTQYLRDVRTGNATVWQVARLAITRLLIGLQRIRGMHRFIDALGGPFRVPQVKGSLRKTPALRLDLRPGESVRVKSLGQIRATLDSGNKNRGLSFDVEMAKYCGGVYRVLKRVDRLIDEPTGRMREFATDCIILDQVYCAADYHGFCPRAIYPFWREIWLERITPSG